MILDGSDHPKWQGSGNPCKWFGFYVSSNLYHEYIYLIPSFRDPFSIFEIYPQSEIPLLTKIADFDRFSSGEFPEDPTHLLPDTLICRMQHRDKIVFRVLDYRMNCSTCFSADVNVREERFGIVKVFFVLSKAFKLTSNYLLGRHSR